MNAIPPVVTIALLALSLGCQRGSRANPPNEAGVALADEATCAARGDLTACRRAALAAIEAHDDTRAMSLSTHACEAGHLLSCKTLGWLHENGRGTPRDPAIARRLYARACEGGELSACKSLGLLWDTGVGGAVDRRRAAALYQRACDANETDACNNLANLYVGGDGVTRDVLRAAALYDRVCAFNHSERACGNAIAMRALADASVDAPPTPR